MISFKDFEESKILDYSIEELKGFLNEIELKRSVVLNEYAEEAQVLFQDKKFDVYSISGSKKIKKAARKIAPALVGLEEFEKIIKEELNKREELAEMDRYSGRSIAKTKQVSKEEFLQKEADKTWAHRSKIE